MLWKKNCTIRSFFILLHKHHSTSSPRCSNNASGWWCARCCVVHSLCYSSTEVPGYLYGGADGSPACAQHFLPVGASLWQMGPGSWTKLISSTPPLKGTVECLLYLTQSQRAMMIITAHQYEAGCLLLSTSNWMCAFQEMLNDELVLIRNDRTPGG